MGTLANWTRSQRPIFGSDLNHEEMMLGARLGRSDFQFWKNCGGITTLDSYGDTGQLDQIPAAHFRFRSKPRRDDAGGTPRPVRLPVLEELWWYYHARFVWGHWPTGPDPSGPFSVPI